MQKGLEEKETESSIFWKIKQKKATWSWKVQGRKSNFDKNMMFDVTQRRRSTIKNTTSVFEGRQ